MKNNWRRYVGLALAASLLLMGLAGCGEAGGEGDQGGENYVLTIGAGSSGGGSYQIGAAYCEIINRLPNITLNIEETAGGIENINLISDGYIDIGTAASSAAYQAIRGEASFEIPVTNLMGWIPMYQFPFQIVVLADSDINNVTDLIGKNVSVNEKGNAAESTARQIFTALNMMKADGDYNFNAYYLSYSDALDNMKIGKIDAMIVSTGAPTPTVLELEATNKIRILDFTEAQTTAISAEHPYYAAGVMEAGTYSTIQEDVLTVMPATLVYISSDIPEDVVYDMTKAIWENTDALEAAHATQKYFNAELVNNALVPILDIHPGALRYYEEVGIIQ